MHAKTKVNVVADRRMLHCKAVEDRLAPWTGVPAAGQAPAVLAPVTWARIVAPAAAIVLVIEAFQAAAGLVARVRLAVEAAAAPAQAVLAAVRVCAVVAAAGGGDKDVRTSRRHI